MGRLKNAASTKTESSKLVFNFHTRVYIMFDFGASEPSASITQNGQNGRAAREGRFIELYYYFISRIFIISQIYRAGRKKNMRNAWFAPAFREGAIFWIPACFRPASRNRQKMTLRAFRGKRYVAYTVRTLSVAIIGGMGSVRRRAFSLPLTFSFHSPYGRRCAQ